MGSGASDRGDVIWYSSRGRCEGEEYGEQKRGGRVWHDVYRTGSWVMLFSHGSPTGEQPCGRGTIVAGSLSKSLGGLDEESGRTGSRRKMAIKARQRATGDSVLSSSLPLR
jgi:hypothetical protein